MGMIYIHRSNYEYKRFKRCSSCLAIIRVRFNINDKRLLKRIYTSDDMSTDEIEKSGQFLTQEIPCLCDNTALKIWQSADEQSRLQVTEQQIEEYFERKHKMINDKDYDAFCEKECYK